MNFKSRFEFRSPEVLRCESADGLESELPLLQRELPRARDLALLEAREERALAAEYGRKLQFSSQKLQDLSRLVLCCIEAKFCNQILIRRHFSRSTKWRYFCTAPISLLLLLFSQNCGNVGDFFRFYKNVFIIGSKNFKSLFFAENFTKEVRASSKLPDFKMNEMPFNPLTGERFIMKTGAVEVGGLWQPTLLVQDPTPFGRVKVKKDTLSFGSTSEAHTDGNWRN